MGRANFNCCHISFAFVLKMLNFLQAFVGVSVLLYSVWMLNQWNTHQLPPVNPPPLAPSPAAAHSLSYDTLVVRFKGHPIHTPPDVDADADAYLVSGFDQLDLTSFKLPAPWFIYSFMGVGIILCCISFIGCIAAESIHGCCLCFYTILNVLLILLEAALVAFIAIDHRWEKDLPFDPTGELDNLHSFIEENSDLCKWVGIAVVVVQALALLLAIILRAMVSTRRNNVDPEADYDNAGGRTWEPLLNPQLAQTSGSAHSDNIWSSRIREKYGLGTSGMNSGEQYSLLNQNASASANSK